MPSLLKYFNTIGTKNGYSALVNIWIDKNGDFTNNHLFKIKLIVFLEEMQIADISYIDTLCHLWHNDKKRSLVYETIRLDK